MDTLRLICKLEPPAPKNRSCKYIYMSSWQGVYEEELRRRRQDEQKHSHVFDLLTSTSLLASTQTLPSRSQGWSIEQLSPKSFAVEPNSASEATKFSLKHFCLHFFRIIYILTHMFLIQK